MTFSRALTLAALGFALTAETALASSGPTGAAPPPGTRPVLLVGNNWDGTADILDVPSYERLKRINVIPDYEERMAEAAVEPDGSARLLFIRTLVGEGHDQWVDDLYVSNDGRTLFVARPSFADVVAIDIATNAIVWRTPVWPGYDHVGERADHMAMSPDGTRLAVSTQRLYASTPDRVGIIDTATGELVGTFDSAVTAHENVYSRDGTRIFHASIGRVFTSTDDPALDATKGERTFRIVDVKTLQDIKTFNMGAKLAEAGFPNMSSAVRPMALSPDEKWVYFQVSFFHGFVEFDLEREKVTRVAELPLSDSTPPNREDYILDSAHHGIAMSGDGKKLCVAGTMSNYAAIVRRDTFAYRIHPLGARTYWSTSSADGRHCYVSVAGDDTMSIISYETEREVARVKVGYHPQRARNGNVSNALFGAPPKPGRARPGKLLLRATPSRDRRAPFRFQLSGALKLPRGVSARTACKGLVRLDLRRRGAVVANGSARLRLARRGGCTYRGSITVPSKASKRGRLVANARFPGNELLLPRKARAQSVRIG